MQRLLVSALGTLLAVAGTTLLGAAPAQACEGSDCPITDVGGNGAGVGQVGGGGTQGGGEESSGGQDSGGGGYDGPFYQYRYVVACLSNGPENPDDVLCGAAVRSCDRPQIRYRVYRRLVDETGAPKGGWEYQGTECRGGDEPSGVVPPQVTTPMVMEYARRLAPKPSAHVEPNGDTYVNVPNNFYADAGDVDHTVTLFGRTITISFQVSDVTWDFGDGSSGVSGRGVADAEVGQPGAVEHAYATSGGYDVTATSSITVVFTLPGGETVTRADAITMTSEAVTVPVGEIQTTVTDVG